MTLFKPIKLRNFILETPILLAPLCGITDSPFRRVCSDMGAGLTFVEMISATAIKYNSKKTFEMMKTHHSEKNVAIQLTSNCIEHLIEAVEVVDKMEFPLIDLNMGCPARKVVNSGGGSSILKEPSKIYEYVSSIRKLTQKPISVKLRSGWDKSNINIIETSKAAEEGGADLITVHGRTRADTYSRPNNLDWIRMAKENVSIPVIGNGDLFSIHDIIRMKNETGVDGVMLARGILGHPYLFKTAKLGLSEDYKPNILEWRELVLSHIRYFEEFYENTPIAVVTMRKHLLWYCRGWKDIKRVKTLINNVTDIKIASQIIEDFVSNYNEQDNYQNSETIPN